MNQLKNKPVTRIARAIDAGFGVMKYTRAAQPHENAVALNGVVCDSFLSIAIDADKEQVSVESGRKRDTVLVSYEDRSYEVGKDVRHTIVASDFGRDMTDSYYESRVYHALMRGALVYMDEPHIDTLVLGLPMNHFENKERVQTLQKQYTGSIDLGHGRSMTIGEAIVHPQPFGGYLSLGHDLDGINKTLRDYPECALNPLSSVDELGELNVLIVDPGEYTLDWLLMTPGGQAQRVSSAAGDAGRHRVLRDVRTLVSAKLGRPLGPSFLTDIDVALREKKPLKIGGRTTPLDTPDVLAVIEKAVEDPVRQLFEGLRGADDRIDIIAVLGGSPAEVAAAIRRARPYLPVYCPADATGQTASLFANLRGFQEWSETMCAQA